MKLIGFALLLAGSAVSAFAITAPEIDASTGMSAITLIAGAVLVVRGRRR